jgi:hypothetical protein
VVSEGIDVMSELTEVGILVLFDECRGIVKKEREDCTVEKGRIYSQQRENWQDIRGEGLKNLCA